MNSVDTIRGRKNIVRVNHAAQHLPDLQMVEAGLGGEFFWCEGDGAGLEEVEEGLAFGGNVGMDGLGVEEGGKRGMVGAEPVDEGDILRGAADGVDEVVGGVAEVVFGICEDTLVGVGGVWKGEEGGTGGGDDANGAATSIEGVVGGGFVEVADDEDGGVGAFGDVGEGSEDTADALIAGGVGALAEGGHERIDDDEDGMVLVDGFG